MVRYNHGKLFGRLEWLLPYHGGIESKYLKRLPRAKQLPRRLRRASCQIEEK